MNITEHKLKIKELNDKIEKLSGKQRDLRAQKLKLEKELAIEICPFNIGDKVFDEKQGEEFYISSIHPARWGRVGYAINIRKIKKDGTPYQNENNYYGDTGNLKLVESVS